MAEELPNIHPGEVLLEEFLKPLGLSQNRLARELGVPARRVNEVVLGKRSITADTAPRLARYFGTSERFWLGCSWITIWRKLAGAWGTIRRHIPDAVAGSRLVAVARHQWGRVGYELARSYGILGTP